MHVLDQLQASGNSTISYSTLTRHVRKHNDTELLSSSLNERLKDCCYIADDH